MTSLTVISPQIKVGTMNKEIEYISTRHQTVGQLPVQIEGKQVKYEYEGDLNDYFDKFMAGELEFGSWFDHVKAWWKRSKDEDVFCFSNI